MLNLLPVINKQPTMLLSDDVILYIISFVCDNAKNFYEYCLISKYYNNKIKNYKDIIYKLNFSIYHATFQENKLYILKNNYIKNLTINSYKLSDNDFKYFKNIHTLKITNCKNITGVGFKYLKYIHTLELYRCENITDKELIYLKDIHQLYLHIQLILMYEYF